MSNHYHVVLHIDKKQADEWTDIEVVERWHSLFKGNLFSQKFLRGDTLESAPEFAEGDSDASDGLFGAG